MNIKINNKNYTVPQLGFKHMTKMEDMGFSFFDMFQKKKIFSMATAFVGIVVDCERDEAEQLVEQHVYGGGDLKNICNTFNEAIDESDFFKKLLEQEEKKQTGKKAPKKAATE